MITCWDLKDTLGKPPCCNSCHDDVDYYGFPDDLERVIHNVDYRVCCNVAEWLEQSQESGKDRKEPFCPKPSTK